MSNLNIINTIINVIDHRNFYLPVIIILSSLTTYFRFKKPEVVVKEILIEKEVIKEIPNAIKKRSKVNNPENFRFKIDKELAVNFDDYCKDNDISRPKLIEQLMINFLNNLTVEDINSLENLSLNDKDLSLMIEELTISPLTSKSVENHCDDLFLKTEEVNSEEDIKENL